MDQELRTLKQVQKSNNASSGLAVKDNGEVIQSLKNCYLALNLDEKLQNMFRYNIMTDRIELQHSWWKRFHINYTSTDENYIRLYLEAQYGLTSEKHIPRAVDMIANEHAYHPICDYLNKLQWDGVPRINELLPKYLGAPNTEYTREAMRIFLLAAISRVFTPGIKFDSMICLVEDKQGGGKSTIARFLAIQDEWFTDDIKNLDDENVYRKLQGHWIVEFSEMLAASNTKTVEAVKAFLSRQKDTYKIPYDRYPHDFPRQCVFIGTTNNLDFLPNDKTGNRRFIPILINSENAEVHPMKNEQETRAYIIQCWAEAMEIYRSGNYSLDFPKHLEAELQAVRQRFEPEDPKVGIIQNWLDDCEYTTVCSMMIYREALGNEYSDPKRWELTEISSIMNKSIIGWEKHPTSDSKVRFKTYGKQRAWNRIINELSPIDDDNLEFMPALDGDKMVFE